MMGVVEGCTWPQMAFLTRIMFGKADLYKKTNQACCLFLKVLINLRNPNYENGDSLSFRTHLGLIQVPLKVKDIPELVSIDI